MSDAAALLRRFRARWDALWTLNIRTPQALGAIALAGLTLVAAVFGAVWGSVWLFGVAVVLGILADQIAEAIQQVGRLFDRSQLGLAARQTIREFSLVVLLTRIGIPDHEVLLATTMVFAVIIARAAAASADRNATDLQMPKVLTRNITLSSVEDTIPVRAISVSTLVLASTPPVVVGIVSAATMSVWPFLLVSAAFAIVAAGWTLWRMATLMRHRRTVDRQQAMIDAAAEIARLRPEAILYFSGPASAVYQVNMWLPTMEKLGRPVVIVLRERENLDALAPTTLPVLCIPIASDLMDFRLPAARVAFYVAHVGKNIHLLREPRIKHVFIGHGESDKAASVNPVSKGFDEIWVAGRASRERWAAAKVGVRDEQIVEVGRPQLGGILPAETVVGRPLSVLYAPTWEGWVADPYVSSVVTMGPALVAWLLQRTDIRLIYKPHPFTGSVSRAAAKAHAEILSLIEKSPRFGRLTVTGNDDDQAWAAVAGDHLIVQGPKPSLYDCFNHSDLLIGDISSVVPDYVASGKPYLIPNPAGRNHDDLRAELASTRAAYLLDPGPEGWDAVFNAAVGDDPLRTTREQLRVYLLGPRVDDPVQPWRDALTSLIDRANREWPNAEQEASHRGDD